jgi:hypothetical protein
MGAFSKLLTDSQTQAALQAKQSENQFYAQNGGAPGVPVEAQQQADWLSKNPGKGPSDYVLWKLKNSPTAMVTGNMFAANDPGLDLAAQNYRLTGQLPSGLTRSPGSTKAIIDRAGMLDQQGGGLGIAANKSLLGTYTASAKKLQTNYDQVQAFEGTAQRNMDLLEQTAKNIPDLSSRYANIPVRAINSQMIGTENMAKFHTALYTAQTEAAKVLNSSNATGVLSDSARHELQSIIDGNAPLPAILGSLSTLKQEFGNRTQAYQQQIGDLQQRIKGAGSNSQPNQPQQGQQPSSNPFAQFGGVAH